MKLYSAYYSEQDPFNFFKSVENIINPKQLSKDGALILWGGEDISPSIYKQKAVKTNAPETPSRRDLIEIELFKAAVSLGIPIIGVCRGAQLACALSGGSLFQHIEGGHHGTHYVDTKDGHTFKTSSCHHQALNLEKIPETDYELLAWDKNRSTKVWTDQTTDVKEIPEVVLFKQTKVLGIQGHPEWMHPNDPFVKWCIDQFKNRLL